MLPSRERGAAPEASHGPHPRRPSRCLCPPAGRCRLAGSPASRHLFRVRLPRPVPLRLCPEAWTCPTYVPPPLRMLHSRLVCPAASVLRKQRFDSKILFDMRARALGCSVPACPSDQNGHSCWQITALTKPSEIKSLVHTGPSVLQSAKYQLETDSDGATVAWAAVTSAPVTTATTRGAESRKRRRQKRTRNPNKDTVKQKSTNHHHIVCSTGVQRQKAQRWGIK